MRALFIHQNFPGQFRHVATALARRKGNEVLALADAATQHTLEGVRIGRYKAPSEPPTGLSRSSATLLQRFRRAEVVAGALTSLRQRGFRPDVIVGHPGWGELLLVPEIFPGVPMIVHAEFYYSAEGSDVGFDPEFPDVTDEVRIRLKAKNLPLLAAINDSTVAVAPTAWQASRFPEALTPRIRVIHEGIRTSVLRPDPSAAYEHGLGGRRLTRADEVITFVNRNLEPMRGYHVLMRALPAIMAARPHAQIVIVGGDGVSYGAPPPPRTTWKTKFLDEVAGRLPMDRVHFVGQIPYSAFTSLMQVSRLHIYATYPFVLSWSMLEAMSAGALVLASATPPVTEVIEHGRNGLLYNFFDVDGLTHSAIEALSRPASHEPLRDAARRTIIERYDLDTVCLPAWRRLVIDTAGVRADV